MLRTRAQRPGDERVATLADLARTLAVMEADPSSRRTGQGSWPAVRSAGECDVDGRRDRGRLEFSLLHLHERDGYLSAGAIAKYLQLHLLANLVTIQTSPPVINCMDRLSIHGSDHIAQLS